MATVNGSNSITNGSGDAVCRAELDWTKSSDTETYVIYKLSVYIYCIRYGYTTNGALSATLSCSGQTSKSVSGQSCSLSSGGRKQLISTVSYKFEKKTSSWSPSIKFTVKSTGSSVNGTSTGTFSPTISALTSYNVTYNSNGGSGSIATQKKYYGKSLTLAKSGFTRTNYTLIGWNTSSAGTGTHYNLGATYTTNAARSLYAEWKQNYIAPKITNLKCYRVDPAAPDVQKDDGTAIRVTFNYTGGTINGGSSYIIPYCIITIGSSTVRSDAVLSSATGSFADVYGGPYSTTSSYKVTITLHDTTGNINTVVSSTVGPATFPIDLLASGNNVSMGVMHPAQSGTPLVTAPLKVDGALNVTGNVAITGSYTQLYKVTSFQHPINGGINANSYVAATTITIPSASRVSGYNLVGIVGHSSNYFRVQPTSNYVSSNTSIYAGFANWSATNVTADVTITFWLLWLKATSA